MNDLSNLSRVTHILNCQISKALFKCNRLVGSRNTQVFNLLPLVKPEMISIRMIRRVLLKVREAYL